MQGRITRLPVCAMFWLLLAGVSRQAGAQVEIVFGAEGLTSIQRNGAEMMRDGRLRADSVILESWDGSLTKGEAVPFASTADKMHQIVTQIYRWGEVRCAYAVKGDALTLTFTVSNKSAFTLQGISLHFADLNVTLSENAPAGEMNSSVDTPGIVAAKSAAGSVALCNEAAGRPLYLGFLIANGEKNHAVAQIATFREERFPRGWLTTPQIHRPIYPGASDTCTVSLRFGANDAAPTAIAPEVFQNFAKTYPSRLNWPDRRLIGTLHLATSEFRIPKNPRGWFNGDKTVDTTTEAGLADFKKRLMKYAEDSVAILKAMNAQGMIVWDLEGEEFPHATTYLGDPRSLPAEMEPLADEFFKKFTDAGLRVGLCLRPSQPVRSLYGVGAWQMQTDDPAYLLAAKIEAAKKRWHCSLFYVDSNVNYNPRSAPNDGAGYELSPASLFQQTAAANPDVLLMPEQKTTRYYAYTAPYSELRGGFVGTPDAVRAAYPDSFSAIYVPDGDMDAHRAELVMAVKRGDILMFRAWWNDLRNSKIKSIYDEAKH